MAYVIKSNLPTEADGCKVSRYKSREEAVSAFSQLHVELSEKYITDTFLRNDRFSEARDTIQVLADGFFHYVELYKE